tara:strand:- start:432 stop:680 length:249 start_codon:yes stop_codon:yes gene_type:complete
MLLARNLLITALILYCCFRVFKISSNAGVFFLPLLFVLPPLFFAARKASKTVSSNESCVGVDGFAYGLRRLHEYYEGIAAAG